MEVKYWLNTDYSIPITADVNCVELLPSVNLIHSIHICVLCECYVVVMVCSPFFSPLLHFLHVSYVQVQGL